MKFESLREMYEYLVNTGDLYNKRAGHYVYNYNDANVLCVCVTAEEKMKEAAKIAKQEKCTISAVLDEKGIVYDNPEYDQFKYSKKEEELALYLKPSIAYCHEWHKCDDWVDVKEFFTFNEIAKVEELNQNMPMGVIIRTADTILRELMKKENYRSKGISQEIFNLWKNSTDKETVEQMFFVITGRKFTDYLEDCRKNITVVYTEDTFRYEKAKPGDYVTQQVVDNAMNCLPPVCMTSECAQMGEAYSHWLDPESGTYRPVFATFKRITSGENGIWEYCGHCFARENNERGTNPAYL